MGALLASLLPDLPSWTQPTPQEEAAFGVHCRTRLDLYGRAVGMVSLAATLLWWPLDPLIYGFAEGTVAPPALWRLVTVLGCGFYLLCPRAPWFQRWVFWLQSAMLAVSIGSIGYAAGLLGGLERPWFYLGYPLVLTPMLFPLSPPRRMVMLTLTALGWFSGLLVFHPENLHSRYLPMSVVFLLCVGVVAMLLGHFLLLRNRDNFLMARALGQSAVVLEAKVAEKTRELRRLLAHLQTAREDERRRVARELHDELGQELTALRYAVSHTRERFHRDPPSIAQNLSELELLLSRTRSTVQNLVAELRPRVLDDLGLLSAVEWLLKRTEERSGVQCRLLTRGDTAALDGDLDGEVASAAFRIVQESLTNVMRHAGAMSVEVGLAREEGALVLWVRDDGRGFTEAGPGMGLIGMRERAAALGGSLQISSVPGAGTEVRCRLRAP